MVVLVGIIVFSGYQIFSILSERSSGKDIYEKVTEEYVSIETKEIKDITYFEFVEKAPNIYVDFDRLMAQNPDICGWILFPNTNINYPVVKGNDNSYYLSHTSTGEKNSCGAIFVDMNCSRDFTDAKTIVYGHRMNNGSMFENLLRYRDQLFYDKNPVGVLITPEEKYVLAIVGAGEIPDDLDYYHTSFIHNPAFESDIQLLLSGSGIKCNETVSVDDNIVMLSTCVKGDHSKRFIVVAKLVPLDEYNSK